MEHKIINCPHCGKIIAKNVIKIKPARKVVTCPECGSQRNCKDGMNTEKIQRYLCWDCGYRFS
jgi:transposase-like protein